MKPKRVLIGSVIGILTFAAGLAIVAIYGFAMDTIDRAYTVTMPTIENVPQVVDKDPPFEYKEPLIMDYQPQTPIHWPRLKNARLAFTGEWVSDEDATKGYENWLGLFRENGGYRVKPVGVRIKAGSYIDQNDEERQTREVIAKQGSPLFVFKGIPGIKPGNVKTVFDNTLSILNKDGGIEIPACNGLSFWLWNPKTGHSTGYDLYTGDKESYESDCSSQKAVLSDETTKQILSDPDIGSEEYGRFEANNVVWIGDLDGDARPDLILDHGIMGCEFFHNFLVLYLSSQAKKGELVAPVAGFES